MYETCGTTAYGTMGRGAVFSSMQMRGSQHRFHRSLLLSFFFLSFRFGKNRPVEGRATVAFHSAVVSEHDYRLLACQNSFTYSHPSPAEAVPTHTCWHTTHKHTHMRVHTHEVTVNLTKKRPFTVVIKAEMFSVLLPSHTSRSHSRPRVMCTE